MIDIVTVNKWKSENSLEHLGMPHYVASGSHKHKGSKYRFLILPRYEKDLEVLLQAKKKFNLKTVLTVSIQIMDILEYIHSKGYVHSDIKASNILLGRTSKTKKPHVKQNVSPKSPFRYRGCNPVRTCRVRKLPKVTRNLRPNNNVCYLDDVPNFDEFDEIMEHKYQPKKKTENADQLFLLDYGLATKYVTSSNEHKAYCGDERRAHAGTLLFCSRDAHKGMQSRRSDLECLGYNIIYWLTSNLPWIDDLEDPEVVEKKKQRCIRNINEFLKLSFPDYPKFLLDYFTYLGNLQFDQKPDYRFCKRLFKNALKEYGYKDNGRFDFDNLEGWGQKQKKIKGSSENYQTKLSGKNNLYRFPLHSNVSIKPILLRKMTKSKKTTALMNWSRILFDPEIIIKQRKVRDRKITESSEPSSLPNANLDLDTLYQLNPTYAMIEVFNKSKERQNNSGYNFPIYKADW